MADRRTVLRRLKSSPRNEISVREKNLVTLGVVGTTGVALLLFLIFNAHAVVKHFSTYELQAVFAEAGGLTSGNEVRLAGREIGTVSSVELDGATVLVTMRVDRGVNLPAQSRAEAKTATALGLKYVALVPQGGGELHAGDRIPLSRTTSAYDLVRALGDLSSRIQEVDTKQLAGALDELSTTFAKTPNELGRALEGMQGLSRTIADRDAELRDLFRRTAAVTQILADRRDQVRQLIADGSLLAAEINNQHQAIRQLLTRLTALIDQLDQLVDSGKSTLTPALKELRQLLIVVNRSSGDLDKLLDLLPPFVRGLGETVGSGPFYTGYVENLAPGVPIDPNLP